MLAAGPPRREPLLLLALLALLASPAAPSSPPVPEHAARLEHSLLSMLSLPRRPRPERSKTPVPAELLELYRLQVGQDVDTTSLHTPGRHTRSANTVRTFTHKESKVDKSFSEKSNRFRLAFDVSGLPEGESLQAADVQLTRLPSKRRRRIRVLVHDIVRPGLRGVREPILRLLDSKVVEVSGPNEGSVTLDVLPAVKRWRASPSDNHGLLIEVVNSNKKNKHEKHLRLRRSTNEDTSDSSWVRQQPILFTYTEDERHRSSRTKRSAPPPRKHKRKEGARENCQRHALYVNFEEVGWNDWIVAPPGYDAFYCHGDCPFPLAEHLNTTNHAVVQTLMNSMSPSMVPKACCVPTELSSISMLYLDEEGKVVLKNYKDMAVQGCGCR